MNTEKPPTDASAICLSQDLSLSFSSPTFSSPCFFLTIPPIQMFRPTSDYDYSFLSFTFFNTSLSVIIFYNDRNYLVIEINFELMRIMEWVNNDDGVTWNFFISKIIQVRGCVKDKLLILFFFVLIGFPNWTFALSVFNEIESMEKNDGRCGRKMKLGQLLLIDTRNEYRKFE